MAARPAPAHPFQAVFQSRHLWLWILTRDGAIVDVNDAALDAGVSRHAAVARPLWDAPWFAHSEALRDRLRQCVALAAGGEEMRLVADVPAYDGVRRLDLAVRPHPAPDAPAMLVVEGRDRTDAHALERERDALLAAIDAPAVLFGIELQVRAANPAARTLLGDAVRARAGGPDGSILAPHGHPAAQAIEAGRPVAGVPIGLPGPDGVRWLHADARPLRSCDADPPHGAIVIVHPAIESDDAPDAAGTADDRDPLTGLPDREAFFGALRRTLDDQERVAVIVLDLDHFRRVNDVHGHGTGDRLLCWLAERLEGAVRPEDLAARLGADEFALLLRGVHDDEGARVVADRVREDLETGTDLDGVRIDVLVSMGLARAREGHDAEALMREAQYAVSHAKRTGRGRSVVFDDELGRQRVRRLGLEAELEAAVARDQLEVFYQPLVDAKGHAVIGAEALMRWRHPERGLVPPGEFIPAAEQSGQIIAMETWLQRAALAQLREWNRVRPELHLSLNLSARQLERPDFVDRFADVLRDTRVDPGNLIVEITETIAMQHPHEAGRALAGLADLGVSLAIDDFGTGFSNLGQLQHLPFQIVKIDRGFLRDVPENQRNFALVRTIIAMAQSLDLHVIAEGVETKTQAEFLYWEGATWLQGFHFGRPMPTATFGQVALGGALPLDAG